MTGIQSTAARPLPRLATRMLCRTHARSKDAEAASTALLALPRIRNYEVL